VKGHKTVVIFLIKFFLSYFLLFAIYSTFLQKTQINEKILKTDPITSLVANQTVELLQLFNYNSSKNQHLKERSIMLIINGKYTARVIEGCNSVSIIILFIAFIIAFAGTLKATVLFTFLGSIILYCINIARIAFLTIMMYRFPNHQVLLHNLIFPAIIYSMVFMLWILWVHKFSNYKK
jgi:exosortase family protein XrtF